MSDEGGSVVWYACKYAPAELLAGYGASTRLANVEADTFEAADQLAHGNLCGYGKSLLASALSPDVHALVLTTCCDVMRRIYDVLVERDDIDFLYLLDLPHNTGKAERRLMRSQLARLAAAYGSYSGRTFDPGLALASFAPPVVPTKGHVTVVGAHAPGSLMEAMRESITLPVSNVTCTGARRVASPPSELARTVRAPGCGCDACIADDPAPADALESFLDWYAPALLGQTPCMRMNDVSGRSSLTDGRNQEGIVYHTMKFCDYYGFEYADAAKEARIPMLKIETDGTRQSAGQLRTRLKAFDETLHGMADDVSAAARSVRPKGGPTYVLGVDSGSTSTDAVVMDGSGKTLASVIVATGAKATAGAAKAIEDVLEEAHLTRDDVTLAVATGYGRDAIPDMDSTITEITCHAAGAHLLVPEARTVIDIGGQDSKVIHLTPDGGVANFVMNDKCAAGTGRFLEMMARTLEMPLAELSRQGLEWKHEVRISSMCTVFAESEVVSLIADDTPTPDIIHGLDVSVATKTSALAKRVKGEPPYLMTGGVANNEGVVRALAEVLGAPVRTHPDSQLCGAIGAAWLGLQSLGA